MKNIKEIRTDIELTELTDYTGTLSSVNDIC